MVRPSNSSSNDSQEIAENCNPPGDTQNSNASKLSQICAFFSAVQWREYLFIIQRLLLAIFIPLLIYYLHQLFSHRALFVFYTWAAIWTVVLVLGRRALKHFTKSPESGRESANEDPIYRKEIQRRRQAIVQMTFDAWKAYEENSWGQDVLRQSHLKRSRGSSCIQEEQPNEAHHRPPGATILASLSTLWVMGLADEFTRGRAWVLENLDLNSVNEDLSVSVLVSEYIGGLLSCFALTDDSAFLGKARALADSLWCAYETPTGLPHERVNLNHGYVIVQKQTSLSDISHQLELTYLSACTRNPKYRTPIENLRTFLSTSLGSATSSNLLFDKVNVTSGTWSSTKQSTPEPLLLASFIKAYIQSGGYDAQSLEMYESILESILRAGMVTQVPELGSPTVAVNFNHEKSANCGYVDEETFSLGACLALAGRQLEKEEATLSGRHISIISCMLPKRVSRSKRFLDLAGELTASGSRIAASSPTGLVPERLYFDAQTPIFELKNWHTLSGHLAESYFILWRSTHQNVYREAAWALAQAIEKHAKTRDGYRTVLDVEETPTRKGAIQPVELLSSTLKYLYLIFSDDEDFSLEKWVFNSSGHPLPIKGTNEKYPQSGESNSSDKKAN